MSEDNVVPFKGKKDTSNESEMESICLWSCAVCDNMLFKLHEDGHVECAICSELVVLKVSEIINE